MSGYRRNYQKKTHYFEPEITRCQKCSKELDSHLRAKSVDDALLCKLCQEAIDEEEGYEDGIPQPLDFEHK